MHWSPWSIQPELVPLLDPTRAAPFSELNPAATGPLVDAHSSPIRLEKCDFFRVFL